MDVEKDKRNSRRGILFIVDVLAIWTISNKNRDFSLCSRTFWSIDIASYTTTFTFQLHSCILFEDIRKASVIHSVQVFTDSVRHGDRAGEFQEGSQGKQTRKDVKPEIKENNGAPFC